MRRIIWLFVLAAVLIVLGLIVMTPTPDLPNEAESPTGQVLRACAGEADCPED